MSDSLEIVRYSTLLREPYLPSPIPGPMNQSCDNVKLMLTFPDVLVVNLMYALFPCCVVNDNFGSIFEFLSNDVLAEMDIDVELVST